MAHVVGVCNLIFSVIFWSLRLPQPHLPPNPATGPKEALLVRPFPSPSSSLRPRPFLRSPTLPFSASFHSLRIFVLPGHEILENTGLFAASAPAADARIGSSLRLFDEWYHHGTQKNSKRLHGADVIRDITTQVQLQKKQQASLVHISDGKADEGIGETDKVGSERQT